MKQSPPPSTSLPPVCSAVVPPPPPICAANSGSTSHVTQTGWLRPWRGSSTRRSETTCSRPANRTHLAWRGESGRMRTCRCLRLLTNDPQPMPKSLEDKLRVEGLCQGCVGAFFCPGFFYPPGWVWAKYPCFHVPDIFGLCRLREKGHDDKVARIFFFMCVVTSSPNWSWSSFIFSWGAVAGIYLKKKKNSSFFKKK